MATEFEENRCERRSFYCPNKLWQAMQEATNDCYSVSEFIKQSIKEKLEREFKKKYRET